MKKIITGILVLLLIVAYALPSISGRGRYSFGPIIEHTGGEVEIGGTAKITTTSGDLIILPTSGIIVIGDAGATSNSLTADDDLFVSGKLEVDGGVYFDGSAVFNDSTNISGGNGAFLSITSVTEETTIAVGSGNSPVVETSANLLPVDSMIVCVAIRVTQAPGGGATELNLCRQDNAGTNADELIDAVATTLGTTANFIADGDTTYSTPFFNATADKISLSTDTDVTGTDMKVRIVIWYQQIIEPTS